MAHCDVIKDLIPLYAEGLTNEQSAALVEQHLAICESCQQYFAMVKKDVTEQQESEPAESHVDNLIGKIASYQHRIKLTSIFIAMLLANIISGAEVQFLATIPLLVLVPLVCRLVYDRSFPIILAAIPFALIGGVLGDQGPSFIPFFAAVSLAATAIGVASGWLIKIGWRQMKLTFKTLYLGSAIAITLFACLAYFSFWGHPMSYVDALLKTRAYVHENYEHGVLTFKGLGYNFKTKQHYGRYEYVLNGIRQMATIEMVSKGQFSDSYRDRLHEQFAAERSAHLHTYVAAAVDFAPMTITAAADNELAITADMLNDTFRHLSYDLERRNQAAAARAEESGKLSYDIVFGPFSDEPAELSREQFIGRAQAIFDTLQQHPLPFESITLSAAHEKEQRHTIRIEQQMSEQQFLASYQLLEKK